MKRGNALMKFRSGIVHEVVLTCGKVFIGHIASWLRNEMRKRTYTAHIPHLGHLKSNSDMSGL